MGVLLTRGRMLSNASFARLLDFGGVGEQSATGVCFRQQECFERDRPLLCVCIRVTAERCVLRYSKMTGSGLRMKIEV